MQLPPRPEPRYSERYLASHAKWAALALESRDEGDMKRARQRAEWARQNWAMYVATRVR